MKRPWRVELSGHLVNLHGDELTVPLRLVGREEDREIVLTLTRAEREQLRLNLDWADAYGADGRGYTTGGREA